MADYCQFCEVRHPEGGTKHLVLNGGKVWLEFCPKCGDKEVLTNQDGEEFTLNQIFNHEDTKPADSKLEKE